MRIKSINLFLLGILTLCSCQSKSKEPVDIWLIGDSTMARKSASRNPESGWGEGLKEFFTEKATIHNHAASGRSTRSFITEKRWETVKDSLKPGDFVIIQFGHNDEKNTPELHTNPETNFKENLEKFILETKQQGAHPILCSAIVRRHFESDTSLVDTHGTYIDATQQTAKNTGVPYVDMEQLTHDLVLNLGRKDSADLYMMNRKDSTHLNHDGAKAVARLFIEDIQNSEHPLAFYLKSNLKD
ncbi:MAG: rhamnogalacturonan acetylesterase [Bacteroidota bacterium]|nr:rhamnogalacturonan acetylesterase [Bacteroidota bacterium]